MKQQLSETLRSRTFLGLLLAQFTATFNDQAIHMVAIFYSVDMLVRYVPLARWIDDKAVVAIVTACFIAPFLMFSSFAGPLGDRFSKRSVIVFWKLAEVGMMLLAFVGLLLPHLVDADSPKLPTLAHVSSILVISTVFLMGMHSTFFVPAKLGAMPEILHPSILSRGNGMLEGTSFFAQILGTSAGGVLYSLWKGEVDAGKFEPGGEWKIGAWLLALALVGTATALLMRPIPAAAPNLKLSWNWLKPLNQNLGIVARSQPLTLSVIGIAFCVFMTLFLRQTLLYQGEIKKELRTEQAHLAELDPSAKAKHGAERRSLFDRILTGILPERFEKRALAAAKEPELQVALLFALVGLGVGLGSVVAGILSGHRIELGLVPVGAATIIVCTLILGMVRNMPWVFMAGLFGIGCGAGFYLVPLYTQLQHRAPKESKGNVVSASNFLNVVGGIIAVGVFYATTFILERTTLDPVVTAQVSKQKVETNLELLTRYVGELGKQRDIPHWMFALTSLLTVAALWYLFSRLRDFFLRTGIWIRSKGHNPLRTIGIEHMPVNGPVILLANSNVFRAALDLVAAVDRYVRVVLVEQPGSRHAWLQGWAEHAGMFSVPARPSGSEWSKALGIGLETLRNDGMVALTVDQPECGAEIARLIDTWRSTRPDAVVLPVYCTTAAAVAGPIIAPAVTAAARPAAASYPRVVIGEPLPPQTDLPSVLAAIERLASVPENGTPV